MTCPPGLINGRYRGIGRARSNARSRDGAGGARIRQTRLRLRKLRTLPAPAGGPRRTTTTRRIPFGGSSLFQLLSDRSGVATVSDTTAQHVRARVTGEEVHLAVQQEERQRVDRVVLAIPNRLD